MEPANQHSEQRRSVRCAVSGGRHVELRIDGQRYPGRMLDQSAGGFAVLLDCPPQVGELNAVALHTDAGDFEVRIAFVSEDTAAGESHAPGEPAPPKFRVGLARIRDIDPLEEGTSPGLGPLVRLAVGSLLPRSTSGMFTGLGLALLAAAVPILLLPLFGHISTAPKGRGEPAAVDLVRYARSSEGGRPAAERTAAATARGAVNGKSEFGERLLNPAHDRAQAHHDELRRLARGAPGAAAFQLPEVARWLRLTPHQQQHIAQFVELAEASLAELSAQAHTMDRATRAVKRQAILDAARQEAVAALDEMQQALWRQRTQPQTGVTPDLTHGQP